MLHRFTTTIAGKKVDTDVDVPETATGWLEETGYTDEELGALILHAWKVVEIQPELRQEEVKSEKKAAEMAAARLEAGRRQVRRTGRKVQALRDAGFSEEEIAVWRKMQAVKAG